MNSINFVEVRNFLDHWQSLSGALIGAALPISFALILRWLESRRELIVGLGRLEKMLVLSVISLYEIRENLELFLARVREFRRELEESKDVAFALDSTNFPSGKAELSTKFLNVRTRSLYLSNNLMSNYVMLQNINEALSEIREEFQLLKQKNFDLVLSGRINPENQKTLRIGQLLAIEKVLGEIILSKNIPIAVKALLRSRIVLSKYLKSFGVGKINRWRLDGFNGKNVLRENGQEILEQEIENDLDLEFCKVEKSYKKRIENKK